MADPGRVFDLAAHPRSVRDFPVQLHGAMGDFEWASQARGTPAESWICQLNGAHGPDQWAKACSCEVQCTGAVEALLEVGGSVGFGPTFVCLDHARWLDWMGYMDKGYTGWLLAVVNGIWTKMDQSGPMPSEWAQFWPGREFSTPTSADRVLAGLRERAASRQRAEGHRADDG